MLNYKLKPNAINQFSLNPLEDYLRSIGINEVAEFIGRPSKDTELAPELLANAYKAVNMLCEAFEDKKKIFLIVDCDTDGYTSSAIFYNYFKKIYPNSDIQWMLHEEKQHGIELDKIPEDREVIIVPDAGSNQEEELSLLSRRGKTVIVMDHHQVEKDLVELPNVVIVNNQTSPQFPNKALSGAGVVFKIVQLFDSMYGFKESNALYDLAALGIIADCMDSRTLDNNYIIHVGLDHINNPMFKALIKKQEYSIKSDKPHKMDVSFYIAPLINGVIRMGTMEEKELLFRGFIEHNHTEYYEHTWRGSTTMEDFYQRAARIAYNVKNEQNRIKMKCMEFLKERIEENGLDRNKIIAVVTYDDDPVPVPKTITGLVAMELLKLYKKPALVLRPTVDKDGTPTLSGSGRSNSFEELPSFLAFVRDQEESVFAQGHSCAFGAPIRAEEFGNFIDSCNEKMAHIDFENDAIMVDAIFGNRVNHKLLYEFANAKHIYGNQIPQPLVAIDTTISSGNVRLMGADMSSVRIEICGVPCVKFKDKELAAKLQSISRAKVVIIGKPVMNEFKGALVTQIMIDHINIEPIASGGLF